MSKLRVRGTLVALFFFTAVAVFPNVVQTLKSKQSAHKAPACDFRGTGVLIADGGDPVPRPPIPNPPSWLTA